MTTEERQIQLRRDSLADWQASDPTLANGEVGVETDTHRARIGDSTTAYTSLPIHQPISVFAASADVSLSDSDDYTHIFVTTSTADRTITLPTAADNPNRMYVIKKVDSASGSVTIDGEGAETIDGDATKLLTTQYSWMQIVCDGSAWHVVDFYHAAYDTGWTSNSDWTNAELSVTHNLGANLRELVVSVFFSSDGTDVNTIHSGSNAGTDANGVAKHGFNLHQSSSDTFYIQTMEDGIMLVRDDGQRENLVTQTYYYRVLVYKQAP